MFIRQVDRIVMLMAIDAAEQAIVAGCGVAVHTFIPLPFMFATVDGEILTVMIPDRGDPRIRGMTGFTIGWEADLFMVGIIGPVIIVAMAPETGIRRVVVIPVMTGCTVIRDPRMRTGQWPEIIMDGEGRRYPVRICRMA